MHTFNGQWRELLLVGGAVRRLRRFRWLVGWTARLLCSYAAPLAGWFAAFVLADM